ncbi:GFA family protein [Colwellia sp. RE-S-Sl-9]
MSIVTGSCLCESIVFECENSFTQFHLCHCVQCQKVTGSAHASNLFIAPNKIKWLKGENLIKRYDVPNRSISSAFCTECGSGVPYLSGSGKALVVPAGCLDGTPNIEAQDNIFCDEKAQWYDKAIHAKQFSKFPE